MIYFLDQLICEKIYLCWETAHGNLFFHYNGYAMFVSIFSSVFYDDFL